MARLLTTDPPSWFDELNSVAYYGETEFEIELKQHLHNIFPNFYAFSYKLKVQNSDGVTKKPDLALLKKDYKEWWIIETELENHTLEHVKSQVEIFKSGIYNSFITSDYIYDKVKSEHRIILSKTKLRNLIMRETPKILVIVDSDKDGWTTELKRINVDLCVFQIFKNCKGKQAYRLSGQYPIIPEKQCFCRYHKTIANLIEVTKTNFLDTFSKKTVELVYDGKLTKWSIIRDHNKLYLRFLGQVNPIPPNNKYVLQIHNAKKLIIKMV